ncbi:Rrf2 family transcriptional regulator [Clostridium sp. D33t1_170424_F3]|uniref:RrF2 family transcriptional regulator n=1 Tax=Clostridium sp. D33t1_170424_F3 TaxID=2787099 RepID=UPI0018A8EAD3|nr:Rrf2 family transcriptional regulator [Clostridium sp. D33t1_170424_F3]
MTSEFGVAVHALVFLNHKGRTVSSEELSQNICTNPARVRKIMAKLKRAGLLSTKEGVDGGYLFSLDPAAVSLRTVSEALEVQFVTSAWRSGDTDMKCLIASGMADVMDGIYSDLDRLCKAHLEQITIQQIDERIFSKK